MRRTTKVVKLFATSAVFGVAPPLLGEVSSVKRASLIQALQPFVAIEYRHPFWTRIPLFAAFTTLVGLFGVVRIFENICPKQLPLFGEANNKYTINSKSVNISQRTFVEFVSTLQIYNKNFNFPNFFDFAIKIC